MERSTAIAALLFTVIMWGVGPLFLRSAALTMGPADSLVIRYVLVSLLYLALLAVVGQWRIAREDWPRLLFIAIFGVVGYNLGSVFGFLLAPAGIGGLVIGTQPLLIAILAALVAHERMSIQAVIGVIVAFCGTSLLFWRDLASPDGDKGVLLGALLIFGSGLCWSFYVVLCKPLIQRYGSIPITALSIMIATIPMLGFASPRTLRTFLAMDAAQWITMFYLVVPSTFVSTVTWNYGASRLSSAAAGAFLYLVPVIAVAAGALWFGEVVTLEILGGGALILLGVAIAQAPARLLRNGQACR